MSSQNKKSEINVLKLKMVFFSLVRGNFFKMPSSVVRKAVAFSLKVSKKRCNSVSNTLNTVYFSSEIITFL